MNSIVKKIMWLFAWEYDTIENRLQELAKEGLILTKCNPFKWLFKQSEPQNLKYAVVCFKEGSIFNPGYTDNELTYYDYAKSSGWTFVSSLNEMHIFSTNADNPTPFDTEPSQKLNSIHTYAKKNLIGMDIILIIMSILGALICLDFTTFSELFSNLDNLSSIILYGSIIIFSILSIIGYYHWFNKSCKRISIGEAIPPTYHKFNTFIKMFRLSIPCVYTLFCTFDFLNLLGNAGYINVGIIFCLIMILMAVLGLMVLRASIRQGRKLKYSKTKNMVVSYGVYTIFILLFACAVTGGLLYYIFTTHA